MKLIQKIKDVKNNMTELTRLRLFALAVFIIMTTCFYVVYKNKPINDNEHYLYKHHKYVRG